MPYVLGVDIGSSFTTAATASLSKGSRDPSAIPVDLGPHGNVVPSVAFIAEDGSVLFGEAAELVGSKQPERIVRQFQHRIGDTVPIVVGDLRVAPESLYAAMARWVVDRAEELEGAPPDAVSLTYPVSWGDYRITRVRRALAKVGLADATMLREPDAAALSHVQQYPDLVHGTIAVYDLGGSTFSASILAANASGGFELLGEPGRIERLAGGDFDQLVFRRLTERIGEAFTRNDPDDPDVQDAYSVIRRECVQAKETLSFRTEASVPVVLPGLRATVRVVRPEFETMIDSSVRETIDVFRLALESAGLTADDLAAVLLVGGSARIPFVARQLADAVRAPIVVDPDPAGTFAIGAALAARTAMVAAWAAKARSEAQDRSRAEQPVQPERRIPAAGLPVAAMAGVRLRLSREAARFSAHAVPGAVATLVAGMVLVVVVAQGANIRALSEDNWRPGAEAAPWFAPESLREDGVLGYPFGPKESEPDAGVDTDPMPFFALPLPTARATEPGPAPNRSRVGSSQHDGTQSSPPPSVQRPVGTGPRPDPTPHPTPTPTPEPSPDPVPVPDPNPDPAPDPIPIPDPNPDPAPDPIPVPDPAPEPTDPVPDPTPNPDPAPDPEPIPQPAPESPVEESPVVTDA